jgi:hypothetical protein
MLKIFFDESGDLGFSDGSSKWFTVAIVLTLKHRKVEKCIKKVHKGLRKKYKKVSVLHAYNEQPITRKRILQGLNELDDIQILSVILNKEKVHTGLREQKQILYNYVTNILLDRLNNSNVLNNQRSIEICFHQRETNKVLNVNFLNYLNNGTQNWQQENVQIKIKKSHDEKCLQAVDFVSWAIFRKYEQNDYDYYNIIKEKIISENFLFK